MPAEEGLYTMTIDSFYRSMRGKYVAFCGLGGSNLPLIPKFVEGRCLRDRARQALP